MNPEKSFTILALGDSLTEGWCVHPEESYPLLLEEGLRKKGWPVTVINAGISGEFAFETLPRVERLIKKYQPQLTILCIGANDGLCGMSISAMEENIRNMLDRFEKAEIPVLFCGMKLFFNLGAKYAQDFEDAYARLAKEKNLQFVPFFLKGVAMRPSMTFADGVHPNAKGYEEIVRNLLPEVEKALEREGLRPLR